MSAADGAEAATASKPAEMPQSPFLATLVRQMRAHDLNNVWEKKSDAELLEPFVLSREQRRRLPIIGDPDRRVIWRLEQFYNAIGLSIEQRAGLMPQPMMQLSHEGYGRIVLIAGRLVILSRNVRDIHRFGFDSLADVAAEGDAMIAEALAMLERYPEVAGL
jgi:probable nitrogen fixation protein